MAKPAVDGLEQELEGLAAVLRIAVTNPVGGELAGRYGVRAVPTFVLLDGEGAVMLTHAGAPNRGEIVAAVEGLLER